ncbi:NADH dehydrogenase 1 subunit C2 [Trichonephila clavipes]|nr:NADH dehydrogenase 1 subunit C2 [Trichonephila clavipes]
MPFHKESVLSKYFYPVGCAIIGAGGPAMKNYLNRRPFYAGIQKHAFGAVVGFAIGYYYEQYTQNRYARRDAVIKHYIELHPEDFVVERKKYKEIFEDWYPIRGTR